VWLQNFNISGPFPKSIENLRQALRSNDVPELQELTHDLAKLNVEVNDAAAGDNDGDRPSKRIRLDSSIPKSWQEEKYSELVKATAEILSSDNRHLVEALVDNAM
jgi:hypothetical protein